MLVAACCCLLLSAGAFAAVTVAPNDPKLVLEGRYQTLASGEVALDHPGCVYVCVSVDLMLCLRISVEGMCVSADLASGQPLCACVVGQCPRSQDHLAVCSCRSLMC